MLRINFLYDSNISLPANSVAQIVVENIYFGQLCAGLLPLVSFLRDKAEERHQFAARIA